MGKLICCSSPLAKKPYLFPMTRTKVYSMEEVCYYIRNNIYIMQEEVFDESFAEWIREELGMAETADKMDHMRADHNNLKDIVVTLCCSCDYYSEQEINELIKIMDQTAKYTLCQRLQIKADSYLQSGSIESARQEYETLIKSPEMLEAEPEDYGKAYHGLGLANARMGEYRQAAEAFQKAYGYNERPESMEAYLYCLKLGGFDAEYDRALDTLELSTEKRVFLQAQFEETVYRVEQTRECRQVARLLEQKNMEQMVYKDRIRELIRKWKQEYRMMMN